MSNKTMDELDLKTQLNNGARVSTVLLPFMGMSGHPYETMVFTEGDPERTTERRDFADVDFTPYHVRAEAERGHARMVAKWEAFSATEVHARFLLATNCGC